MIKDNITASIAAAAKSVLLGESPEGPRSEGEKKFVALHQIQLLEPPSDPKAEEAPKGPDSIEVLKKADEPQDAEVPGQDKPVKDPSNAKASMTEGSDNMDSSCCCEPISRDEITEVLSKSAPASDWIHDFVNSDDPRFAGKSKEERIKMALGAYYGAQKESIEESVELNEATLVKSDTWISELGNVVERSSDTKNLTKAYEAWANSLYTTPVWKYMMQNPLLDNLLNTLAESLNVYIGSTKAVKESVSEATIAPGADEGLETEYKKLSSDSARKSFLDKKNISPGISTLRRGDVKLSIKNELNGKKTIYATDT